MIGLMDAIHNTLISMVQQNDRTWNRDTSSQAASLSRRLDFEFLLNLHVTQSVLSFAAGLTEHLQKRGIDLVEAIEHSKQVTRTLQNVRKNVASFHHHGRRRHSGRSGFGRTNISKGILYKSFYFGKAYITEKENSVQRYL